MKWIFCVEVLYDLFLPLLYLITFSYTNTLVEEENFIMCLPYNSQIVVPGPAASVTPKDLLEWQLLRVHSDLLSQKL